MTILRLPDVLARTGLSRSRVYVLEAEGRFPDRVELGANSVGWLENEVDEWIASRSRRRKSPDDLSQSGAPQG